MLMLLLPKFRKRSFSVLQIQYLTTTSVARLRLESEYVQFAEALIQRWHLWVLDSNQNNRI